MATFLFWNINRKPLSEAVYRLAELHRVDVLMLAESPLSAGEILVELNREDGGWQFVPSPVAGDEPRVKLFVRFDNARCVERLTASRWAIWEIFWPNSPPLLLATVHLPSKWTADDHSQAFECIRLAGAIRSVEAAVGHERTLLVGDFNMNPFESGMLASNGLHSEASRAIAANRNRVVEGETYPFFYNPMWNFFGDEGRGPGGTYFHRNANRVRLSWNMFDQVLVRPDLLPFFDTTELEILTEDGEQSFLTRQGTPATRAGSDHLPLLFKLNL